MEAGITLYCVVVHHHQLTTTIATSYDVIWISAAANQIADHNHVRHDIDPVMGQHTYKLWPPPKHNCLFMHLKSGSSFRQNSPGT